MSVKSLIYTILIGIVLTDSAFSQSAKPYGLMTDLLEHTDKTWKNGFITNIPVWQTDSTREQLQYAEIRSQYPSFSWIVQGEGLDIQQTAYHIIVSDSYGKADSLNGNVWDSGEIPDNQSTAVNYTGKPLEADQLYFWRVKSMTNLSPKGEWSDTKAFRTAKILKEYAAAYYPPEKTSETPVALQHKGENLTYVDFGKAAFGQLLITLSSEKKHDTVTIHLGETVRDGRIDRNPTGTIRYKKYTIPLLQGVHTYRIINEPDKRNTGPAAVLMPDYIGEVLPFRYCEIEGYDKPFTKSDIIRESVSYPFDYQASEFSCSNDTLNQIWELCKYSIRATSFAGIYVDGDRERIPYEADALINQLCHYSVDREYSMARRTSEYLLAHPTWPSEWILQAVMIARYDYLYTGDSRSLRANYDILKARTLLALREKNGLISTRTGLQTDDFKQSIHYKGDIRDIVDWPQAGGFGAKGESDGFVFTDYNAVVNAYHYESLKLMAQIAKDLNINNEAVYFQNETEHFYKLYNKMFFNRRLGCYTDGVGETHASLHGNMFALAFGLVPDNHRESVLKFIHSRGMACSVYGSQFLLDALYEANDAEYALKMLTKTDDRGWYNMIREGSTITLEAWDNKYKPNQDWNHAWGAAPANIIPRKLVGVEPLTPGFGVVRIRPQIAGLEWVKAKIPTVKGEIHVDIQNKAGVFSMRISIPANMEAEVYLPQEKGFVYQGRVGSGRHEFAVRAED
ncbi:MAG: family 78 glycoside hydrolase catalytic domain [Tannerella sp.]|jgi:hypothetical protein|nr:family 78 glycoside hydrolase catalytic domain [Tannerella sp.]